MKSLLLPPHPKEKRIVFKNAWEKNYTPDIDCYIRHGGYEELRKAITLQPENILHEIKQSNLRGRGGAGFPCGIKWGFIQRNDGKNHYLICNGDESEPGTFKDRYILHNDPHQLLEGMIIASYTLNVHLAYIYIRCEFPIAIKIMNRAIQEAYSNGFLGKNILGSGLDLDIYVHQGAAAYICGEETSMIESLEGKRPYPRIKPPYFPAVLGLYQQPTIVNNVETLCHIKHIVRFGGDVYAKIGVPGDGGTRVMCVSGDVLRPGPYEIPAGGVTLGELIFDVCGGMKPLRKLKAVIPGGSSAKVLRAGEMFKIKIKDHFQEVALLDIVMDASSLASIGTMIGSGGVIIMDDTRNMLWVLNNLNQFYAHESCGQCTPCREGSLWMSKMTTRMLNKQSHTDDKKMLKNIADNIAGRTICAFGEACSWPTQSFIEKFPEEFTN